jgi:hypothetical protein
MDRRLRQEKGRGERAVVRGGDVEPLQKIGFASVRQVNGRLQAQEHDNLAMTSRRNALTHF